MNELIINFLLLISSILGMYLYMSWTTQQTWKPIINFLYDRDKRLQENQQFQIMVTTCYYLVLIFLLSYLSLQLYKILQTRKSPAQQIKNNPIIQSFYEVYRNSFYEIITFICLYFYFIKNNDGITTQLRSILIPFWFLSARIFYFIGYVFTGIAGINLKYYGNTLTFFTYAMILGESFKYNAFQLI